MLPHELPRVAIVGGGLGGIMLAIGLMEQNIPFHIYESAPAFRELGAGISFGPNAVKAMQMLSAAVFETLQKHSTTNEDPATANICFSVRRGPDALGSFGELLFDVNGSGKGNLTTEVPTRCCVHRAPFLDDLIKLLPPGHTSFNKTLAGLQELESGDVRLQFTDGSSGVATAAVGCDGLQSVTQRYLHANNAEATFAGAYAYRAMVPRKPFENAIGDRLARACELYVSPGAYILTYPVEQGRHINVLATRIRPEQDWGHKTWTSSHTEEDVRRDFIGWPPQIINLLVEYGKGVKWALLDRSHSQPYSRGHVCVLGDAAHATTPHLGAGAGMAIEDAYILSRLLGYKGKSNIAAALEAYDHVRRPRSQKVIEYSRLCGRTLTFLNDEVGDDHGLIQRAVQKMFDWLWDEDLVQHLAEATNYLLE